jgi:hypothetical protein
MWGVVGSAKLDKNFFFRFVAPIFLINLLIYLYGVRTPWVKNGSNSTSLRDLGTYINAGHAILNHTDPYDKAAIFRSGSFAASIFGLIPTSIPTVFIVVIWQVITLLGFIFLFWASSAYLDVPLVSVFIPIIILYSSVRENLVDNQLTGFLSIVLGILLIYFKKEKHYFTVNLGVGVLCAFAIDLKMHLFFIPIFFLILASKRYVLIFYTITSFTTAHFLIDLYCHSILELSWLNTLRFVGKLEKSNLETASLWKLFGILIKNNYAIIIISWATIMALIILCVQKILIHKISKNGSFVLGLLLSLNLFFNHYYDYSLLLIPITCYAISRPQINLFLSSFIVAAFISGSSFIDLKILLILAICGLFLLFSEGFRLGNVLKIVIGFFLEKSAEFVIFNLVNVSLRINLLTTLTTISTAVLVFSNELKKSTLN